MAKQLNGIFREWMRVKQADEKAPPIIWGHCIVHLSPDQLRPAFAEMLNVLRPGGVLLLSFHVGSGVVRVGDFLGAGAALDFTVFDPADVRAALADVGFDPIDVRVREPYPSEHPTTRGYVFAHRPVG